jgi:anti-anti-sigma factor
VWLRGEHDASTAGALSQVLTEAAAVDAGDLALDLGAVEFMGAATVGVILGHREVLHARSRALTLRNPSRCARRVLELCDLLHLVDMGATQSPGEPGTQALGSWVPLLTTSRVHAPSDGSRDAADPLVR